MYSSLHNHTMYSLLDGYSTPDECMERAKNVGLKAFAVTEHGNIYSHFYFEKLKKDYPEIKIIYGVEFYECFDKSVKDKGNKYFHLIALARNEKGRIALNKLVTKSNFEGFYYKPRVDLNDFRELDCGKDLVVCSACLASKLAREADIDKCVAYIKEYKEVFPYFYLEMQSHSHNEQALYNKKILELSRLTDTPYVITTDSHAAKKEDLYYQSKHVQIAHDSETGSEIYEGCYIQSDEEIHGIMDSQIGYEAVCEGLENTNKIADMTEEIKMPFQSPRLPTYPLPDGFSDNLSFLQSLIKRGWYERGFNKLDNSEKEKYISRTKYELETIHNMGFDGYFLIVWDFINYAKSKNIAVAPGRGSCAGSLVCYLLHITEIDPMKYGLIFERFLNPERVSLPDVDSDLSDRSAVIAYLSDKYGSDKVCQILNFSFITPVVAIKDVGKILGFSYAEMDSLSKKFTYPTFEECLKNNRQLVENNPKYTLFFDIASKLSGRVKTVSTHAGGVGIVDGEISDYAAMKKGEKGEGVIQTDKRITEEIGIVKFDILGVKTLSLIKEIQLDAGIDDYEISINNPAFENDKASYELLDKALTNGVFQVESAGMKDLLLRLKPDCLEDLSAVLALYRPDSMGALEEYIECKHNPQKVSFIHEDMETILKNTYGCMLYQEQLLDIVRTFGGRSYGGADLFRKAIGKKNVELVKTESAKLYNEIIENGYSEELAKHISDELSEKGGYLFNKSHSYCYAVICLQTAYLKAHYPLYFFKALFNLNKDKTGMLNKYILDAKDFGIEVLPPDINKSEMNFSVKNGKILFGLSAIRGIGETFAEQIISERKDGFKSMTDFCSRVNPNTAQMVYLIKSGAIPTKNKKATLIKYLKSLYIPTRFTETRTLPSYKILQEKWNINIEAYRNGAKKYDYDKAALLTEFNRRKKISFDAEQNKKYQKYIEDNQKYLQNEDFWEFEALQIFVNNNPFDKAYKILESFEDVAIGDKCTIVGIVSKVQKKKDKNNKSFAFVNIYSSFGLIECIVWHSQLKEYEDILKNGSQLALFVKKEGEDKAVAEAIKPYETWLSHIQQRSSYLN